jgi:hypothetical protein
MWTRNWSTSRIKAPLRVVTAAVKNIRRFDDMCDTSESEPLSPKNAKSSLSPAAQGAKLIEKP